VVAENVQALTNALGKVAQEPANVHRVLLVGDTVGVPRVLRHLDNGLLCGIVGAEIRPQYHAELAEMAADRRVEFLVQPRVKTPGYSRFVSSIRELAPDLILCDSYSMLLRPEVLGIPVAGAINVHAGLLPRYRGSNPVQWTIIDDEDKAGVSIHYMDEGFDSGDMIARREVPVLFTDTWRDVMGRIDDATDDLEEEFLPAILTGRAAATPQDPRQARHHRRRTPADGRIEWSQPVRDIYNLVRALVRPLPGAFYVRDDKTVLIDDYMTIAEVAALKQQMIGGKWQTPGAGSLRVNRQTADGRILLDVFDIGGNQAGEAELQQIDYRARTATLRWSPEVPDRVSNSRARELAVEFARKELGIASLQTQES
jgi:methionyl-tRNA formyltransferase